MTMRFLFLLPMLFLLPIGCTPVKDIGRQLQSASRFVKYSVQGEHYLSTKDYQKGEKIFQEAVEATPENGQSHYFLGRFQLALKKNSSALKQLKKAVTIDPDNADYFFWLGVAHAENRHFTSERKSYTKALNLKDDHLQALIYLGHNQLRSKRYTSALAHYQKALTIWPQSPSSLYNRALLFKILKRTPEEKLAWLEYLDLYPSGSLARRATEHLNALSDFSYRNHALAARTVTLAKIRFDPFTAKLSKSSYLSLDVVGATVSNLESGVLQVIAYQKNNKELARQRAISIKRYMQDHFPKLHREKRIQLSWFPVPEKYRIGKRRVQVDESIRFFLTKQAI